MAVEAFYLPESPVPIPQDVSVVVDAIDTVSAKLHLAQTCYERGIPLISCMGMGNRLDPTLIRVGDIIRDLRLPLVPRGASGPAQAKHPLASLRVFAGTRHRHRGTPSRLGQLRAAGGGAVSGRRGGPPDRRGTVRKFDTGMAFFHILW